jgi:hypothetical protein
MKSNVVKVSQPQHSQHFMEFHVGSLSFLTSASLSLINKVSFKLLAEHHVSLINVTRVGDGHSFTGVLGIWLSFDRVSNKCIIKFDNINSKEGWTVEFQKSLRHDHQEWNCKTVLVLKDLFFVRDDSWI